MFKKGHTGHGGGRKKGTKNKPNSKKGKNQVLDTMYYKKEWVKGTSKKVVDIPKMDYYIYNNLPLDDLLDDDK